MSKTAINAARILELENELEELKKAIKVMETSLLDQIDTSKAHLEALELCISLFKKHNWVESADETE